MQECFVCSDFRFACLRARWPRRKPGPSAGEALMPRSEVDVVVVGGGAAGDRRGAPAARGRRRLPDRRSAAAARRARLHGLDPSGFALDLGCGWLHSADRNPWVKIAQEQGAEIDKSRPPWARRSLGSAFRAPISRTFTRPWTRSSRAWKASPIRHASPRPEFARTGLSLERTDQRDQHTISAAPNGIACRRRTSTATTTPASIGG